MSKVCQKVFLDRDGKPSSIYENNLHLGEAVARSMYIDSMKDYAFSTKRINKISVDDFIAESKKYKRDDSTQTYSNGGSSKNLKGVTSTLSDYAMDLNDADFKKFAEERVIKDHAISILKKTKDLSSYGYTKREIADTKTIVLKEDGKAMTEAVLWSTQNRLDFEQRIKNQEALFSFKTEAGTEIHKIAEDYINARNELVEDENGDIDIDIARGKALSGKSNIIEYDAFINKLEAFLQTVGNGRKMRFETEVAIWDDELGVGGRIDLVAFDNYNTAYIFDFKTKEEGKEYIFDTKRGGKLKGVFKDLYNNKETQGALQTSTYRLLFERKGFVVKESRIIYIEGKVKHINNGSKFYYKDLNVKKTIPLPNYREQLNKMFIEKGKPSIDKIRKIEPNKSNNYKDVIGVLLGQNIDTIPNIGKKVAACIDKPKPFKDKKGIDREGFYNKITGENEAFTSKDTNARKLQLTEYFNQEKELTSDLARNFKKYFDSGKKKWNGSSSLNSYTNNASKQANNLLAGIDISTHTLEPVNSLTNFSHVEDNVMLARHRISNEAILITINHNMSRDIEFDTDKSTNTTIFGQHISDKTIKTKYNITAFKATTDNVKLLESGLLLRELKKEGHVNAVYSIKVGYINGFTRDNGSIDDPVVIGVNTLSQQIKILSDIQDVKDTNSVFINELFEDIELNKVSTYKIDYTERMLDQIFYDFPDLASNKEVYTDVKEALISRNKFGGKIKDIELKHVLIKAQQALADNLSSRPDFDEKSLALHKEYNLISHTILQLANVELNVGEISKLAAGSRVRVLGRIPNPVIQALNSKVLSTEQNTKREYSDFHREHSRLTLNLLKAYNVGLIKKITALDNGIIFRKMFVIDPTKKIENNPNNRDLYRLLNSNDIGYDKLMKEEKEYIDFFNKSIQNGFKRVLGGTKKYNDAFEPKNGNMPSWELGRVPIISASLESRVAEETNVKNKLALIKNNLLNKNEKKVGQNFDIINLHIDEQYSSQMGIGYQGSDIRRNKIGIDAEGNVIHTGIYIENNLEAILNKFMADNFKIANYEETLGIYKAINLLTTIEENQNFHDTKDLREFMKDYVQLVALGEYDSTSETTLSKVIDKGNKWTTMMALAFSIKQFFLETATSTFGVSSSLLAQYMDGNNKRFNATDLTKAGAMTVMKGKEGSLAGALVDVFGMYNSDSEALSSKDKLETRKYGWWQSKWSLAMNNEPYKFVKSQTFLAELIHLGVMDALSLTSDGIIKYEPHKDERFKILFNSDGSKKKNVTTELEKKTSAHYEYLLDSLEEENGVKILPDGSRIPLRPLNNQEVLAMKAYALSLYGSMDKEAKLLVSSSAFGRLFMKFRNWVPVKINNYWTTGHMSEVKGGRVWIEDSTLDNGGYYEYQKMWDEGILQTLWGLKLGIEDIYKSKDKSFKDIKDLYGGLNINQQRNLNKLVSDTIIVSMLTVLFSIAFADKNADRIEYIRKQMKADRDNKRTINKQLQEELHNLLLDSKNNKIDGNMKLLLDSSKNAMSDLNIFSMSGSMISGNPIVALSYASRTLDSSLAVLSYATDGDMEKATTRFLGMTGAFKTINAVIE